MGWKALKEAFGIQKHIVCVGDEGICIGSGYVSDLATINTATGALVESKAFTGFIKRTYPELANATPEELLVLLQAEDTFGDSIKVYTYRDGEIIEKQCEVAGWPNATHDGELMYENTFSIDKITVIGWAKRNARLKVSHAADYLARLQQQLADAESDLARARGFAEQLDTDYPDVPAAG